MILTISSANKCCASLDTSSIFSIARNVMSYCLSSSGVIKSLFLFVSFSLIVVFSILINWNVEADCFAVLSLYSDESGKPKSISIETGFKPFLLYSQIFLIARFEASDKPYRMQKLSISLSINAFRFSSLVIV